MNSQNTKNLTKLKKLSIAYLSLFVTNFVIFLIALILLLVWQYSIKNSVVPSTTELNPKILNINDFLNSSSVNTTTLAFFAYLLIYLLIIPIHIAMIILLILAAIIAPNQKYLVLFVVGTIFNIVALVGIIMLLVELKKFPKDATNMNINIPTENKVKVS
ncbi:hypothetical protein ACQRBB_01320 [Mycoplasmopsis bovis]|uniref:hypothetical protein n=1 Tax=Mycoplasmopsis bovis TaxID=28903 RepID=UPI003D02F252